MTGQDWDDVREQALKQLNAYRVLMAKVVKREAAKRDLIQRWVWYAENAGVEIAEAFYSPQLLHSEIWPSSR